MKENKNVYFKKSGEKNTDAVLKLVEKNNNNDIKQLIPLFQV